MTKRRIGSAMGLDILDIEPIGASLTQTQRLSWMPSVPRFLINGM